MLPVKTRIGCLHAHYSNVEYIERAFSSHETELLHFVDPALVYRISSDETFRVQDANRKVKEQIEWIAQARVDAILITCTNYIAILQEDLLSVDVPIIKIDEPFFGVLCDADRPQILLFTNPATVEGTMKRLNDYARAIGKQPRAEARVIPDLFALIMQGKKEMHDSRLSDYIRELLATEPGKGIAVAQLSMAEAARRVREETGAGIGNPLAPLVSHVERNLIRVTD